MSLDYINEAFRSLESLNEDIFSADRDGINELSDFMSSDVDDEEKISIIDMDAETEDDLQDSYVGKIICDCNVCHSHVFKDKDQITIDEEGVVDIDDDCPYCGEHNGFVIIGEITEFNPNAEEEVAEETAEEEEVTEEPAEETADDAAEENAIEEKLEESLNESDSDKLTTDLDKFWKRASRHLPARLLIQAASGNRVVNRVIDWSKSLNAHVFLLDAPTYDDIPDSELEKIKTYDLLVIDDFNRAAPWVMAKIMKLSDHIPTIAIISGNSPLDAAIARRFFIINMNNLEEALTEAAPRRYKPSTMRLLRMIGSDLVNDTVEEAIEDNDDQLNELFGLGNRGVEVTLHKYSPIQQFKVEVDITKLSNNITRKINWYAIDKKVKKSETANFITWRFNVKSSDVGRVYDTLKQRDTFSSAVMYKSKAGESESELLTKYMKGALSIHDYSKPLKLESFDIVEEDLEELNELFGLGKKKTKTYYLGFPTTGSLNAKLLKRHLQDLVDEYAEESEPAPSNAFSFSFKPYYAVAFKITDKNFKRFEADLETMLNEDHRLYLLDNVSSNRDSTGANVRLTSLVKLKEAPSNESLEESFNNVSIETDDQKMTMTSEDNGKVTVTTEPISNTDLDDDVSNISATGIVSDNEVISPVSDETVDELIDKAEPSMEEEVPAEEAPAEEESSEEETPAEEATEEPVEESEEDEAATEEAQPANESLLRESLLLEDDNEDAQEAQAGEGDADQEQSASGNGPEAIVDKLQDADYEKFVQILNSDGKSKAFIDYLKQHYKKGDDTLGTIKAAKPSKTTISCAKLHPTQKNISISKSLGMLTESPDWAVNIINNPQSAFRDPTVTYDGKYIIDGHHRWSKAYALNGDCTIEVLNFPSIPGVDWEDMLKAVQLAIVATDPSAKLINEVEDDNMLASGAEKVAAAFYIKAAPENVIEAMKAKGRGATKEEQANTISNNVLEMQKTSAPVSGAASRAYMPQMNTKTKADEKQLKDVGVIDMTESIDVDFEDFDESVFDELSEAYLNRVYENVESFKTSNVSTSGNQLIIEGVINFKSGNSKKTGFIFEAKEATRDGKVKFIGENAHLCRGRRAFTLAGSLNEKSLIVESLTYNYRAKNSDGKSTRVYGTISRNK